MGLVGTRMGLVDYCRTLVFSLCAEQKTLQGLVARGGNGLPLTLVLCALCILGASPRMQYSLPHCQLGARSCLLLPLLALFTLLQSEILWLYQERFRGSKGQSLHELGLRHIPASRNVHGTEAPSPLSSQPRDRKRYFSSWNTGKTKHIVVH